MNFQAHLENTISIMKEEFIVVFLGGLLIQLLTSCTLGILAGPLMGGYMLVLVGWFRKREKPVFNDLFSGMQRFGQLFPLFFLGLMLLLGFMLLVIPGVIFATWWIYVIFLMVDKNMAMGEAMKISKNKVNENGFFMHLIFLFMISVIPVVLISAASTLIPPLAILQYFLFPLQSACQASLYLEQVEELDPANCFRPEIPQPPLRELPPAL